MVNPMFYRQYMRLYLTPYHPSLTCYVMKSGETGYLGPSLPESKIHGYFLKLFQILVALHYTFLNHLQSSLSDQN
jgi:hypothetical protein